MYIIVATKCTVYLISDKFGTDLIKEIFICSLIYEHMAL